MRGMEVRVIDEFLALVDAEAERRRACLTSVAPGQMLAYTAKQAEAGRLLADQAAGLPLIAARYPWLSAEIGVTAPDTGDLATDLRAVATAILSAAAAFAITASAIERTRLTAKNALRRTSCAQEASTILSTIPWPPAQSPPGIKPCGKGDQSG